jgi:hypothetical protein
VITFSDKFQVTAVSFADAGDQVYSGGLDNTIKVFGGKHTDQGDFQETFNFFSFLMVKKYLQWKKKHALLCS